ncbi:unnamed protein product, partial [marine sediment metagenome]
MGQIFTFNENFGPWNTENFIVYILTAYQINIVVKIRGR